MRVVVPYQAVSATEVESYVAGVRAMNKSSADVVSLDDLLSATDLESLGRISDSDLKPRLAAWFVERQREFEPHCAEYESWAAQGMRSAVSKLMARLA